MSRCSRIRTYLDRSPSSCFCSRDRDRAARRRCRPAGERRDRSARCAGAASVRRAAAARSRSPAATRGRTSTTWAPPAAGCGRRPTAASRWKPVTDGQIHYSSVGAVAVAAVQPRRRLHRHRRGRHSRQHHSGRRRLQVDRRRQDVDAHRPRRHAGDREDPRPPDQPRSRLRRGVRPSRRAEPGSRRLPIEGRRQDLGQDSVPRQQDRRQRAGASIRTTRR